MSTHTFHWGIIGTGNICRRMSQALASLPEAQLAAVGSRRQETADAFARDFGIDRAYDSYAGVFNDPRVEIVYIGTPHNLHHANAMEALEAGKHVLLEKPLCVNALEAREVFEKARAQKLFVLEAFWYRFHPIWDEVRSWLKEGRIGEVRHVQAVFGFAAKRDPESRLFNPQLAGGALLDLGCYPVNAISMAYGGEQPTGVFSKMIPAPTKVDLTSSTTFTYGDGDDGRIATFQCTLDLPLPPELVIFGTEGQIHLDAPFLNTETARVGGGSRYENVRVHAEAHPYAYQAIHLMERLRDGQLDSDILPLEESLNVMKTLDTIRAAWGLRYPFE
ncbi:MAG: Gfo/Idh/MocA family oxidoreductase [Verrucomicrobiota bacterium]